MKKLLVLGAGTAGTIVVNKLRPRLDADDWGLLTLIYKHDPERYERKELVPLVSMTETDILNF